MTAQDESAGSLNGLRVMVIDDSKTIRRTADWYRRFHAHPNTSMREACLADLAAYEKAMMNHPQS